MMSNIRNNLNKIIKSRGIKKGYLAKKLGVTNQTISNWVSGYSYPPLPKLKELTKILDTTVEEIFFNDYINISEDTDNQKAS